MTERIKIKYDFGLRVFEYEGPTELLETTLDRIIKSGLGEISAEAAHKSSKKKTSNTAPHKADAAKATSAKSSKKSNTGGYKPKFQPDLDLLALPEFVEKHEVIKNNTEYLVIFIIFLTEELQLDAVSADDLHTCFVTLKTKLKVPKSIISTFKNAQNIEHVVKYDSGYTNFRLPATGSNLYHHDIVKRSSEAS